MTSKGLLLKGAIGICAALALGACRNDGMSDEEPGADAGHDAARDSQQQTDSQTDATATDTGPTSDVPGDTTMGTDGGASVTIRQMQDLSDPGHPAPGTVSLNQPGMIALTPRLLSGSSRGDSMGRCRFVAWVGDGDGGAFSGVQIQEFVHLPDGGADAGSCFTQPARQIPADLAPGDHITAVTNTSYSEFCAGMTGQDPTMCRNWEATELFGPSAFTRSGTGTAPTPTSVTMDMIGTPADNTPGTATLDYEGVLVKVSGVTVTATMQDGGTFTDYSIAPAGDASHHLGLLVTNFVHTTCARAYLTALAASHATIDVTGMLEPDFGVWKIRIRDENDLSGSAAACAATDAGIPDGG